MPRVEDYNSVVGKAIAAGFGQIIKGIFLCNNAYASQVQKGGAFIRTALKALKLQNTGKAMKAASKNLR